ncbi:hypothetical protein ACFYYP_32925 [Microbispora rosea]|uniref:hypothetical protein n=1 Tax=Microbispora rosea TaxID=58117 RepID=UPI0036C2EE65
MLHTFINVPETVGGFGSPVVVSVMEPARLLFTRADSRPFDRWRMTTALHRAAHRPGDRRHGPPLPNLRLADAPGGAAAHGRARPGH